MSGWREGCLLKLCFREHWLLFQSCVQENSRGVDFKTRMKYYLVIDSVLLDKWQRNLSGRKHKVLISPLNSIFLNFIFIRPTYLFDNYNWIPKRHLICSMLIAKYKKNQKSIYSGFSFIYEIKGKNKWNKNVYIHIYPLIYAYLLIFFKKEHMKN